MVKKEERKESEYAYVEKLLKMRGWIDDNFPKFYKEYESVFVAKAKELGLNPNTIRAFKREFEIRFGVNMVEWMLIHTILHFAAMRQGGVKSRFIEDEAGIKQIKVVAETMSPKYQGYADRMILLMWDVLEHTSQEETIGPDMQQSRHPDP